MQDRSYLRSLFQSLFWVRSIQVVTGLTLSGEDQASGMSGSQWQWQIADGDDDTLVGVVLELMP